MDSDLVLSQAELTNLIALIVTGVTSVVWAALTILEAREAWLRRVDWWRPGIYGLGLFLSCYFALGYTLLVLGEPVDPGTYFRPVIVLLFPAFTLFAVLFHTATETSVLTARLDSRLSDLAREIQELKTRERAYEELALLYESEIQPLDDEE